MVFIINSINDNILSLSCPAPTIISLLTFCFFWTMIVRLWMTQLLPPMDIDILILRLFDFMLYYWDIDTYVIWLYDDSL